MEQLKKELNFVQGVGLLTTSLLGTGIFAIPAITAEIAGNNGLWAWPLLLIMIFPIGLIFAELGKYYPSAGGVAYFVNRAFNPTLGRVSGWFFLTVIPFNLPAALYIASGFWVSLFNIPPFVELLIQLMTLFFIWLIGLFGAGASGWIQTLIAMLIIGLVMTIGFSSSPSVLTIEWPNLWQIDAVPLMSALGVMFWCFVGIEAFVHLTTEFKRPEKDFPRALIVGLVLAGFIYWACTAAVLSLSTGSIVVTTALPNIIKQLFGQQALWIFCAIGYAACFATINIYYQSYARLIWDQTKQDFPSIWLAKLSKRSTPVNSLSFVILLSGIFLILIHFFTISLTSLLIYANGVFVFIYLLAMLSAVRLLKGKLRIIAAICTMICVGLLWVIGYKSLYAIGIFIFLWLVAKCLTLKKYH